MDVFEGGIRERDRTIRLLDTQCGLLELQCIANVQEVARIREIVRYLLNDLG